MRLPLLIHTYLISHDLHNSRREIRLVDAMTFDLVEGYDSVPPFKPRPGTRDSAVVQSRAVIVLTLSMHGLDA